MKVLSTGNPKSKKSKPNAKQRELQASWEAMMKKYEPKKPVAARKNDGFTYTLISRETPKIPSLNSGYHDCSKKEIPRYTGTAIKGIGTMHKSNAIPIFSDEQAIEIATMRRG